MQRKYKDVRESGNGTLRTRDEPDIDVQEFEIGNEDELYVHEDIMAIIYSMM